METVGAPAACFVTMLYPDSKNFQWKESSRLPVKAFGLVYGEGSERGLGVSVKRPYGPRRVHMVDMLLCMKEIIYDHGLLHEGDSSFNGDDRAFA